MENKMFDNKYDNEQSALKADEWINSYNVKKKKGEFL